VTKAISLVLVDDNVVVRDAVANLIKQRHDFVVVVASADPNDAIAKVYQSKAWAVLLDCRSGSVDILPLIAALRAKLPDTRIIVTGVRAHQRGLTSLVKAGASGFIMKDASLDETLDTIRAVMSGGHALPRRLVGSLFQEIAAEAPSQRPPLHVPNARRRVALTNRERQVLTLIHYGLSTKEIALRLEIAADTVRSHVANLFEKHGVRSRLQLATRIRSEADLDTIP
jgi:DNA-binding NarL/FixJ family response regulator